jgi:hypothetical protein
LKRPLGDECSHIGLVFLEGGRNVNLQKIVGIKRIGILIEHALERPPGLQHAVQLMQVNGEMQTALSALTSKDSGGRAAGAGLD